MKLVMNRNITVSSTTGHAICFQKNIPTYVPPAVVSLCMSQGAIPAKGEKLPNAEEKAKKDAPPPIGLERTDLFNAAFDEMVAKNIRGSFSANGVPKINNLRGYINFETDGAEVKNAWKAYKASMINTE